MTEYRLPKLVEEDSGAARLSSELAKRSTLLWAGAELRVPHAELGTGLKTALRSAYSAGRIVRGLESAERALAGEEKGMKNVDRKTGVERGKRVSRLVVLAGDGSERFYRSVEWMLRRHSPRVLGLRVPVDESGLGELLFGPNQVARLLMLEHKDAVSAVLLALAAQWRGE